MKRDLFEGASMAMWLSLAINCAWFRIDDEATPLSFVFAVLAANCLATIAFRRWDRELDALYRKNRAEAEAAIARWDEIIAWANAVIEAGKKQEAKAPEARP